MEATREKLSNITSLSIISIRDFVSHVPLLGWLLGTLIAVMLEMIIGTPLARGMGLPKAPSLFGFIIMLKKPFLIPSAMFYVFLIYLLPIGLIARLSAKNMNRVAGKLLDYPIILSVLVHLGLLYTIFHLLRCHLSEKS